MSIRNTLIVLLFVLTASVAAAQNLNDYAAISSGKWTTVSIWRQWDGTGWNAIPTSYPNSPTANVYLLSGNMIQVDGTGPYSIRNLILEPGARLYNNSSSALVYLNVYGTDFVCDGEIGRGTVNDGISFNFEGTSCTIIGSGIFNAARLSKRDTVNRTTSLSIFMNINLRWESTNNTVLYNNTQAATFFNVTVNSGYVLNCIGGTVNPGNVAIDGIKGATTGDAAGTYTINGTLIVSGILYVSNTNTAAAYTSNFIIGAGGVIKANQINSVSSNGVVTYFTVQSQGKLELTGRNSFAADTSLTWGTGNNRYSFMPGSTVEYSGAAAQKIAVTSNFNSITAPNNQYWNLILSGDSAKIIRSGSLSVRGDLTIQGNAVLDQETNDPNIEIGGNWSNYHANGFTESTDSLKSVKFNGSGTAPATAQQTITCNGGESFYNLWIAKPVNNSVKLASSVTVRNRLSLGQAGTTNFGIFALNGNALTITNPDPSAIALSGSPGCYRFILAEDSSSSGSGKVNWNIGTRTTVLPTTNWPWPYVIPFGTSTLADTIPFGFYKTGAENIGYLSVGTYGTAEDNLPWPSGVNGLNSIYYSNNTPDNRLWTADRYWRVATTAPALTAGAAFSYNDRSGTSSELPANETNKANLRAQYWSGNRWQLPQTGTPFTTGNTVSISQFQGVNTVWTLAAQSSPLTGCLAGVSIDSVNAFCSYRWNGQVYNQSGTYTQTFTLASGCDSTAVLKLYIDTTNRISSSVTAASCFGNSSGSILLTVNAGNRDTLSYNWSNGATTKNITGVPAGTYTVSISDRNNCLVNRTFSITTPTQISATLVASPTLCYGDSGGSISSTPTGGVTPYQYTWSNGRTTSSISNLSAGNYSVQITDANGCTISQAVTLTQFNRIVINSFTPSSAHQGDTITIRGTGFSGLSLTRFGNVNASTFTIVNDSTVRAVVPLNAPDSALYVSNSSGCGAYSTNNFENLSADIYIDVRFFIEGYFMNGEMVPVLANRGFGISLLNVDTAYIALADPSNPGLPLITQKTILHQDGQARASFPGSYRNGNYYIIIGNGNSIATWSAQPVLLGSSTTYDFTDSNLKAYANNQRQVAPGVWAIFSGDVDQDGYVDAFDYAMINYNSFNFITGYCQTDLNGDGYTDSYDFGVFDQSNFNFSYVIHP